MDEFGLNNDPKKVM